MSQWTPESLRSRIKDHGGRLRHAAGSPCPEEIAAYAGCLDTAGRGLAVVLGMTPELRTLAGSLFDRIVSVEISEHAIDLYRDWVPADLRARETVVCGDWLELRDHLDAPADVVLGDGVFPNLPDEAGHRALLEQAMSVLRPGGVLVTRQVVIPHELDVAGHSWGSLLENFRKGLLDDAEFGFGTRILGHLRCCYDTVRCTLDNARVFMETARTHAAGSYSDAERASIERYHFDGTNVLLPEAGWDALVAAAGWRSRKVQLSGRDWYRYYPIYRLEPGSG